MGALLRFLTALALAVVCAVPGWGAADPDEYEAPEFADDSYLTTQNNVGESSSQFHTFDSSSDEDWLKGIVYVTVNTTFRIEVTSVTLTPGSSLYVDIYEDGPDQPPTDTAIVSTSGGSTFLLYVALAGANEVYFRVTPFGSVDPTASYSIAFQRSTGANNGVAISIGSTTMLMKWDTIDPLPPTPRGFNVERTLITAPSNFTSINLSPVPVPPTTGGPCPNTGCVQYPDLDVTPGATYLYRVVVIKDDYTTQVYRGITTQCAKPVSNIGKAQNVSRFLRLYWTENSKPVGAQGYRVYRDGVLLNPSLLTVPDFLDMSAALETYYTYEIKLLDAGGSEVSWATFMNMSICTPSGELCDVDGDAVPDCIEVAAGTNPAIRDTDGDGLEDGVERHLGMGTPEAWMYSSSTQDSDSDKYKDYYEYACYSDPQNAMSYPSLGDVNGSGATDGADVTVLRRIAAGSMPVGTNKVDNMDVNRSGTRDGADVTILRRFVAGTLKLPN